MPRGGKREGSGRKALALELSAREMTSPYIPNAILTLSTIMENPTSKEADRISAAKILLSYYFGQPPQFMDVTSDGKSVSVNIIERAND